MRFLAVFLVCLLPLALAAPASPDMDPEDNDSEDEFEAHFNLPEITDGLEKIHRAEALEEAEEMVKEENEEFEEGKKPWFDAINEMSDLPDDEFVASETGMVLPPDARMGYGRGLVMPKDIPVDEVSESYFAEVRSEIELGRATTPSSFSSVNQGWVSPVKSQGQCGSCVAFANMALIETCFKKVTGVFGDYSEQQLIDCGYEQNGANGCNGAAPHSYIKTFSDNKASLTSEATYPYKNTSPSLTCPASLKKFNQGAKLTGAYYTYSGDEEVMKALVAKHGAVVSGVDASGPFQEYKGGVFAGCTSQTPNHAITVVGYGTDKSSGLDYWLVKNSWGANWGEKGFIRVKRGVKMCGIGGTIAAAKCGTETGPTDATPTTQKPAPACDDMWTNCPDLAANYCYQDQIKNGCKKSCGTCPGATPAASLTCYDEYTNCGDYCAYDDVATTVCKKACGKC